MVRYVNFDPEMQSRDIQKYLNALNSAGLMKFIQTTTAIGLPLSAGVNAKKFKPLFLDIGLIHARMQISATDVFKKDLYLLNRGHLAEQFVGQELLCAQTPYPEPALYFWARDKKNASAEVDFVITVAGEILPIEVKAGHTGRLKSLHIFMDEKHAPLGIQICDKPLGRERNVLIVPFYLVGELERILRSCL